MTNREFDNSPSVSVVALLSRVLMSAIFIWAGFGKLTAAAGTTAYFTKIGLSHAESRVSPRRRR
jgi:uncharacterized membrane protein YphA (DoxX/SURF4 family)